MANQHISTVDTAKYFDLYLSGIGYLNRVREITPVQGNPFWVVSLAALRGSADRVQYTHFECVVVGEEAKDLVRQLQSSVDAKLKVLVGFRLSDLQVETFTFKSGEREGATGVSLKSRRPKFDWGKVEGQCFLAPAPKPAPNVTRIAH